MSFSLNKIMLIGRLGGDQATRFTTSNVGVTTFTLATDHSYKGKNGDWVNETTWHNITAFNLSDYYKEKLTKGARFYVEGRLTKNEYTDKDGIKRYSTQVIVDKLIPLEKSEGSSYTPKTEEEAPEPKPDANDDLPF